MKRQEPYILSNPPKKRPKNGNERYQVKHQTRVRKEGEVSSSTLEYELDFRFSDHFISFKKRNFLVDGNPIMEKVPEIYLHAQKTLNSIEFKCREGGNIKDIYEFQELYAKWEYQKFLIRQEFVGVSVDQIVETFERTYSNRKKIVERLNKNWVLQTFYHSFLNDYLIYYGQRRERFIAKGILGGLDLPFQGWQELGLKNQQLHLTTQAELAKDKVDDSLLQKYCKEQLQMDNCEDLSIKLTEDTLLDYQKIWILESIVKHEINIGDYQKEVELTLKIIEDEQ
ncbi:MAG: hypothetical protein N4A45_06950 [Flavobacteriales bacterium]|jgi:hypothetical protein|nr:hypothetical protein [Flavobacteriales bacterium]